MDDGALVRKARAGDAAAFETLVRRHYGAAFAVALAIVGNRADAEDVCQDGWLRSLAALDTLREPERFAVWLLQITRNTARNRREYLQRRAAEPLREDREDDGAGPDRDDPWADLARRRLRKRLEAALGRLSEMQRQVVLLHDVEAWSHRSIGEALGISEVMSRQHLFQARRKLRSLLDREATEEFGDGDP